MGQRDSGGEDQSRELGEVRLREVRRAQTGGGNLFARGLLIVPNDDIGAALLKRPRGRKAAQPKADDRNVAAGEGRHGNHDD